MTDLFKEFDFALLDDPEFKEDSVREELVAPLLRALGYSASPPYRIIRSRQLEHPFVYIGTVKKNISIIPDYLLERDGINAWILDAKGPREVIDTGKNAEQAYSYAIHRDIRVPLYGLCNGHRLVIFHVSEAPPLLDVSLRELSKVWPMILELLGSRAAWPEGRRPSFLPDFGLAMRKAGLTHDENGKKTYHVFTSFPVRHISRVEDDLYSITAAYEQEDSAHMVTAHMVTIDFKAEHYPKFLDALPDEVQDRVRVALTRQPYQLVLGNEDTPPPMMTIVADPGDVVHTRKDESYCPFIADEFVPEPPGMWENH